jgi:c-di-AMP phosphodiesterase-like protein
VDFKKLADIWGQGYIFIEGIKEKEEVQDFAKYVSKYINKENSKGEDNYDLYVEKDLLNQKRYFISRGLCKPSVYKLNIDKELYNAFLVSLKDFHTNNHEYSNEYVGNVELNNYEVQEKKTVETLNNAINTMVQMMLDLYHTHVKIKWKHVKERFMNAEHYFKSKELSEKLFYKMYERMRFIRVDDWECDSTIFS